MEKIFLKTINNGSYGYILEDNNNNIYKLSLLGDKYNSSTINSIILNFSDDVKKVWGKEIELADKSIRLSKKIALHHYSILIKEMRKLTHKQAIDKLIEPYNNQIKEVKSLENNEILKII